MSRSWFTVGWKVGRYCFWSLFALFLLFLLHCKALCVASSRKSSIQVYSIDWLIGNLQFYVHISSLNYFNICCGHGHYPHKPGYPWAPFGSTAAQKCNIHSYHSDQTTKMKPQKDINKETQQTQRHVKQKHQKEKLNIQNETEFWQRMNTKTQGISTK